MEDVTTPPGIPDEFSEHVLSLAKLGEYEDLPVIAVFIK